MVEGVGVGWGYEISCVLSRESDVGAWVPMHPHHSMAIRVETCSWYLCNKQHISNHQIVVFDSWLIQLEFGVWKLHCLALRCLCSDNPVIMISFLLLSEMSARGMSLHWNAFHRCELQHAKIVQNDTKTSLTCPVLLARSARRAGRQSLRLNESLLEERFVVSTIYQLCNTVNPFRTRKIGLWTVRQTGSGNIEIPLLQKLKDLITFACIRVLVFVWETWKIFKFRIHKYHWGTFIFSLFFFYTDMSWLPSRIPFQLIQRQHLPPRIHLSHRIRAFPGVGLEILYFPQFQTPLIPQWFVSIRFWRSPKIASSSRFNNSLSLSLLLCVGVKFGTKVYSDLTVRIYFCSLHIKS